MRLWTTLHGSGLKRNHSFLKQLSTPYVSKQPIKSTNNNTLHPTKLTAVNGWQFFTLLNREDATKSLLEQIKWTLKTAANPGNYHLRLKDYQKLTAICIRICLTGYKISWTLTDRTVNRSVMKKTISLCVTEQRVAMRRNCSEAAMRTGLSNK